MVLKKREFEQSEWDTRPTSSNKQAPIQMDTAYTNQAMASMLLDKQWSESVVLMLDQVKEEPKNASVVDFVNVSVIGQRGTKATPPIQRENLNNDPTMIEETKTNLSYGSQNGTQLDSDWKRTLIEDCADCCHANNENLR